MLNKKNNEKKHIRNLNNIKFWTYFAQLSQLIIIILT